MIWDTRILHAWLRLRLWLLQFATRHTAKCCCHTSAALHKAADKGRYTHTHTPALTHIHLGANLKSAVWRLQQPTSIQFSLRRDNVRLHNLLSTSRSACFWNNFCFIAAQNNYGHKSKVVRAKKPKRTRNNWYYMSRMCVCRMQMLLSPSSLLLARFRNTSLKMSIYIYIYTMP